MALPENLPVTNYQLCSGRTPTLTFLSFHYYQRPHVLSPFCRFLLVSLGEYVQIENIRNLWRIK